jgi:hypothetical protein
MNFLQALSSKGVRFSKRDKPNEIWMQCPFCGDGQFRLGLNYRKGLGQCFRGSCSWRSSNGTLTKILRRLDMGDVTIAGLPEEEDTKVRAPELPEDYTLLDGVNKNDDLLWEAKRYLLDRGVTRKQIRKYYLGASLSGWLAYRIIIPVIFKGEFLGVVARDWTGAGEPKYLNSTGLKSIWGLKRATQYNDVILAEGCFKSMAIKLHLKRPSAAILGSSITDGIIDQLRTHGHRDIILWPDPDKAGIIGMLKVADRLAEAQFQVSVPYPLPPAQADEMTARQLKATERDFRPLTWRLAQRLKMEVLNA